MLNLKHFGDLWELINVHENKLDIIVEFLADLHETRLEEVTGAAPGRASLKNGRLILRLDQFVPLLGLAHLKEVFHSE